MNRKSPGRFSGKKTKQQQQNDKESDQENVHRRNVRLAAYPLIFLFEIIRILAYQIWLLLSFAYRNLRIYEKPDKTKTREESEKIPRDHHSMTLEAKYVDKSKVPGALEPCLAKQKHHHRKAFEYISKALKLDEEDEGQFHLCVFN